MKTRIAILCSDDAHHTYLVALLRSRFNVAAVVVEPASKQRRRVRQSGRYKDYAYAVYHHLRRTLLGLNAYRRRYFADAVEVNAGAACRMLSVDWVNDPATVELLTEVAPDLTIIICTSILHQEVLRAAGPMIINVHGGYLPYYRGNHCFFFALYQSAFDRIGSTIHFVDPGIDTGDIIENVVPPLYQGDNAEKLYCRAEKLAIHRLADWISHYEQGGTLPRRPQTLKGPLYRTRDRKPHHDIILWLRRVSGRLPIPEQAGQDLHAFRGADRGQ
jgi:methionyl-tRNA formyltransferase